MVVVLPCDERLNVFDVFDVFDVCTLCFLLGSTNHALMGRYRPQVRPLPYRCAVHASESVRIFLPFIFLL